MVQARVRELAQMMEAEQLAEITRLYKGKKESNPKLRPDLKKSHGAGAKFPPAPDSHGNRYHVTRASLTKEARILCGSAALYAALADGRNLQNCRPEECVAFASEQDALAHFYSGHPKAIIDPFPR